MALAALVGAAAGSFVNVCAIRWPEGGSVVSPPSRCTACGEAIAWFRNVPVVGYLIARGRCSPGTGKPMPGPKGLAVLVPARQAYSHSASVGRR